MGDKPKRSWYSILMVVITLRLVLNASISLRAAPKAAREIFSQFPSVKNQEIPSHKTVSNWLTRLGLYKLNAPKEQGNDWALIVDYSIQAGTTKCLLILGVRLRNLKGKPLRFEDVEVLLIEFHEKSTKDIVCMALEKAQGIVGKVVTVCVDNGPDLRKGVEQFCKKYNVKKVYDAIHKIGTVLKRFLGKDPKWQEFTKAAAEAKKKMQQTPAAHLMPPNQRTKSRFLNIEILTNWAIDALKVINDPAHPERKMLENYCGWLLDYKELIERLMEFNHINKHVRQYIREKGISSNTGAEIDVLLEEALKGMPFNKIACEYAGELIDFFVELSKMVTDDQKLIGSSEIIESLFGKLKYLEGDQHKGGFTSLVLGIAACTGSLEPAIVKEAMEQIKIKDVNKWRETQLGKTFLSKRRKAFERRKGGRRAKCKVEKIKQDSGGIYLGVVVGF